MKALVEEKDKGIEFPCLMEHTDSGIVVLFSTERVGVVVYGGGGIATIPVGRYSGGWDMDSFKPFKDRVILEN